MIQNRHQIVFCEIDLIDINIGIWLIAYITIERQGMEIGKKKR